MKIKAARASGKRIALFSTVLLALAVTGFLHLHRRQPGKLAVDCPPVPGNVETLGPPLPAGQLQEVLADPGNYSASLRALLEPGVTLHEFFTATTGGHLALRGRCYVG